MEKRREISTQILKGIVLLFLCIPVSFQFFHWREFTPLNGVQVSKADGMKDSLKGKFDWFNGSYQRYAELYFEENLAVKSPLVRLRNQLEYSIFGKINAQQIYAYNGNLFRFYSSSYNEGTAFIGYDAVHEKVRKLTQIQAYLGEKCPVILAIAPSKTYFCEEDLPKVHTYKTDRSNYKAIKKEALKNGIHVIDFNTYFLDIKKSAAAPLISKSGIHWSMYGAALAMDSLVRKVEHLKHVKFSHPRQLFTSDTKFLYYFNTRKDPTNNNQGLEGLSLLAEMKKADCIILLNDIVNMENVGWGFVERAHWEIGWDKK